VTYQDIEGSAQKGNHLEEVVDVILILVIGRNVAWQARGVTERIVAPEPKEGPAGGESVDCAGDRGISDARELADDVKKTP
jgi:hypothetical protein